MAMIAFSCRQRLSPHPSLEAGTSARGTCPPRRACSELVSYGSKALWMPSTDDRGITGLTHLNSSEHLEEDVVVLGGAEALAFDAHALGQVLSQEFEGEMAQDGEVLGRMALADAALILVEGHIEDPVGAVLD